MGLNTTGLFFLSKLSGHQDRVKRTEALSDLLANESSNPTNLAKELPLPDLDSLLDIVNRDCQTLLLKKIDYFGGSADPARVFPTFRVT